MAFDPPAELPVAQLACALMRRASVTPADAGCLDLIADRLEPLGFVLERIDRNGVSNLWARRGSVKPLMVFAGHTDVVPPGPREAWQSDPFEPELRGELLYGRGAADMKSSLAAFVVAIERFVAACPDHAGSIALLLTSDEEGDAADGTVAVVQTLAERGERMDYCVVGEPTAVSTLGDMIKNGRRGSLNARLTILGVQGHVAYPHLAKNPIHLFAPALAELAAQSWDAGDEYFPPTTWQVSNIHGGTGAGNVIPGKLEVLFNFRYSPASTPERLQARVESILHAHGLQFEIVWNLSARPFLTPRGTLVEALAAAVLAETGITTELSTTGGTSDGRFIAPLCDQVVELGPVNASIHKIDEHVRLADLEPLARIYESALRQLLGAPQP
ncbi:MAG: succinyl-diaminopimelate desuccinylase [Rhodocyclaceae bacterium]|nr:succinyl-diaminopimelate desuccinylase [Rhodocyclaceae bacterium]MBX3669289.1 succinyl-diaminopimelate desuccinylase [Rhodocyclaceae bacterium]